MNEEIASYCRLKAREHDADAYLAALFAAPPQRQDLWALQAFAAEIARVPALVSEPMLGAIRLQWWRETVERLLAGRIEPHPVAEALAEACTRCGLSAGPFLRLIEAQEEALEPGSIADQPSLRRHAGIIGGEVLRLEVGVLAEREDDAAALIGSAGQALGLARILRELPAQAARRRIPLSTELLARIPALAGEALAALAEARSVFRALRRPRLLPAFLPLAAVAPRLAAIAAGRVDVLKPAPEAPLYQRQLRIMVAALRGRP